MDPEREFARRIVAMRRNPKKQSPHDDTRVAEFQALIDVCLGQELDMGMRRHLEELQVKLHKTQEELYSQYLTKAIRPGEYVDSFNSQLKQTFEQCESILGPKTFLRLFGAPSSAMGGFIDKDIFLLLHQINDAKRSLRKARAAEGLSPASDPDLPSFRDLLGAHKKRKAPEKKKRSPPLTIVDE